YACTQKLRRLSYRWASAPRRGFNTVTGCGPRACAGSGRNPRNRLLLASSVVHAYPRAAATIVIPSPCSSTNMIQPCGMPYMIRLAARRAAMYVRAVIVWPHTAGARARWMAVAPRRRRYRLALLVLASLLLVMPGACAVADQAGTSACNRDRGRLAGSQPRRDHPHPASWRPVRRLHHVAALRHLPARGWAGARRQGCHRSQQPRARVARASVDGPAPADRLALRPGRWQVGRRAGLRYRE